MREPARDRERLQHILDAIGMVKEFTVGITREELFENKMRYFAVVKNIEIIGEAANMLTKEFREAHTELPWPSIIAMRNVIVHDYVNVHEDLLWDTILYALDPLEGQVKKYIEAFQP